MKVNNEENIFQKLEYLSGEKHILFIASIEVTHRCNANCEFCIMKPLINKSLGKELSLKQIERLANILRKIGTYHVQISGGEPLVRKDILDIIQIFRERYFAVTLNTNGFLLKDSDISAISKANLLQVIVSFHTLQDEAFEYIWGIPRSFKKRQLENIFKLKDAGVNVVINMVLTKRNIDEYRDVKDFFEDKGINVMWDIVEPQILPQVIPLQDITPTSEQLRNFYRNLETVPRNENGTLVCNAGRNHLTFSPYGEIYACGRLRIPVGKYPEDDLFEIWKKSPFLNKLREVTEDDMGSCKVCPYKEFCAYCIGNNYNTNLQLFKPVPQVCERAKIAKSVYYESQK